MTAITNTPLTAQLGRERPHQFVLRFTREKPLGAAGAAVFLLFLICAVFAQQLAPFAENQTHLFNRLEPPSAKYLLGTDNLGRDVLSRLLIGAQVSMIVGA